MSSAKSMALRSKTMYKKGPQKKKAVKSYKVANKKK